MSIKLYPEINLELHMYFICKVQGSEANLPGITSAWSSG